MSDEAAFLESLKANPADDTTRLVYADWLEEHDRAPEAEYLRLTVALVHPEDKEAAEYQRRIITLGESLSEEWRSTACGRFDLHFLTLRDRAQIIAAIKAVRELTGRGLAEMKAFVETLPQRVSGWLPFDSAQAFRNYLVSQVPSADLQIVPSDSSTSRCPTSYDVEVAFCIPTYPAQDDSELRVRAERAFRAFLAACLIEPSAAEVATLGQGVSVSTGLNPVRLVRRLAELRKRAATMCDARSWTFSIRVIQTH